MLGTSKPPLLNNNWFRVRRMNNGKYLYGIMWLLLRSSYLNDSACYVWLMLAVWWECYMAGPHTTHGRLGGAGNREIVRNSQYSRKSKHFALNSIKYALCVKRLKFSIPSSVSELYPLSSSRRCLSDTGHPSTTPHSLSLLSRQSADDAAAGHD